MTIEPDSSQEETSGRTPGGVAVSFPQVPFSDEWSTQFRRQVEDAKVAGWEIDEAFRNRVIMVNRDFGSVGAHFIILLITGWWTFGIGNAIYAAYRYWGQEDKKVLRDEQRMEDG